jgi:hypothetical protein
LVVARKSQLHGALTSKAFAITDAHYGVTGELRRCAACGFVQCTELDEVLRFYEQLEDPPTWPDGSSANSSLPDFWMWSRENSLPGGSWMWARAAVCWSKRRYEEGTPPSG